VAIGGRKAGGGREQEDSCPGALRPHHAADGELLRLRLPGGALGSTTLKALAAASAALGDDRIGLTSRGNLQVRGVAPENVAELVQRVRQAGLLPDAGHERVRNIISSALSGRYANSADDVDLLAHDLDVALCARPGLVHLPGRFLFALDDGTGDVAAEDADVTAIALGDGRYGVRPAGCGRGLVTATDAVVTAMLAAAEAFLAERAERAERAEQGSQAWRVRELAGAGGVVLARLLAAGWVAEPPGPAGSPAVRGDGGRVPEPGLIEQKDGRFAVCAVTPLGLLTAAQTAALAAAIELSQGSADGSRAALRVTPWRRVVIRDLELAAALAVRELLSSAGLVLTPDSAWARITACAGRPGCAKSLTDVQADARAFAAVCEPVGVRVHWAGCERGCGTPAGTVVQVLATSGGYRLRGPEPTGPSAGGAGSEGAGSEGAGSEGAGSEGAGLEGAGLDAAEVNGAELLGPRDRSAVRAAAGQEA
jgi:precorrin-3B synthase